MSSLASLASAIGFTTGERRSTVYIRELDEADQQINDELCFQYFPDTLTDTKAINWGPKEIPGGSLPLYQFVSSGERSISFTATFTTDVDIVGAGKNMPGRLKAAGVGSRNVDIRSAIIWLRRFMLPRYGGETAMTDVGTALTKAPRKLQLCIPGSGIGWAGGNCGSGSVGLDWLTCIMTGCEISYESFFPSGQPRVASVGLSFAQIAQFNGMIDFPAVDQQMDNAVKGTDSKVFGYQLVPSTKVAR